MSRNVDYLINQVAGGATQRALLALWNQLHADAAANKSTFDAHTHRANVPGSGLTECLSTVGLAIDANPEDVQFDRYCDFKIAGVGYHKAITAAIDISTLAFTPSTLATLTSRAYLFTLNASGTVDVVEGADLTGSDEALAVVPATPAGECAVAVVLVGNKGVDTYKLGSDDLGSPTDYNVTYVNLLRNEPVQVSKPQSDSETVSQGTAVTFEQNLET